jgi:predicted DsbA family dithiol-disulfide isomerase
MEQVKFHFDPRCPWCYQTSRWAKRLEALGEIELDWGVFSLEVINLEEGKDPRSLETTGSPALRTAVVIAREHGSKAIGPFYSALGHRNFEQAPPAADPIVAVRESLAEAHLESELCDKALGDPTTWQVVIDETLRLADRIGRLGVPTIVLDGGEGPAIFGPVVSRLPSDQDTVELWRHTAWLMRYENFAELKRNREGLDELPVMAWWREQQAKREAETTA